MNPLRIFRLVAVLTACGAEAIRAQEIQFDIRRVPVGHGTSDVVVSDLDGDGNLDVAVSGGGEVTVLLGDGTGALQIHERVEAGLRPVDMSLGDLDGDGRLDMAAEVVEPDRGLPDAGGRTRGPRPGRRTPR